MVVIEDLLSSVILELMSGVLMFDGSTKVRRRSRLVDKLKRATDIPVLLLKLAQ